MRRRRQRGIALVLVTWVFMILGVLALDFARYMRDDAVAALNLAEETRNYYVAVAAMNRALYDLEEGEEDDLGPGAGSITPPRRTMLASGDWRPGACAGGACARGDDMADDDDEEDREDRDDADDADAEADDEDEGLAAADGEWHEEVLDGVRYGVRVSDEEGLIPLNGAAAEEGGPALLRHVVKNLLGYGGTAGMDRRSDAAVSTVADSIVDWWDRDDLEGVHGAESSFYLDREPSYGAKNANFDSLEELLQVRGVTPELYYGSDGVPGLKDIFSPYIHVQGQHPKVNLRRAPAPVLQALLGIDAEEAAELITLREEEDPIVFDTQVMERLRVLDPALAEQITKGRRKAQVVRVEARADVSQPRNQARVAAVVELANELTEGIRIIRWFDRAPWQGTLPTGTGDRPA